MANLIYPINLSELYDGGAKNYVQFVAVSYNSAKHKSGATESIETKPTNTDYITLELPEEINAPESHRWESGELYSTSNVGSDLKNIFMNRGEGYLLEKSLGAMNKVPSLLGAGIDTSVAMNQYKYQNGRTIINPNTTLLYDGTGLRSISFKFDFQPMNETEAKTITQIISTFKSNSRAQADPTGLTFPNLWRIITSSDELNRMLEFGNETGNDEYSGAIPFALEDINPTYDTSFLYHNKYSPNISLLLDFKEIRPRYR